MTAEKPTTLAIVLAAGEGTRMCSDLPKVLHPIANRPMVSHVIAACKGAGIDRIAVVVGTKAELVQATVVSDHPGTNFFEQRERKGTAHAVLAAADAITDDVDEVVVLFGDVPLITSEALDMLRAQRREGADVSVLGFETDDPTGYGRMIEEDGQLVRIVEQKDASAAERDVTFCNSGLMAFPANIILALLRDVRSDNAAGELYLPDTVALAHQRGLSVKSARLDEEQTLGVNDRVQLADREARWQRRAREAAMRAGASMQAPDTVFLSADTELGRDCVLEPNIWFGPGVKVGDRTRIRANSHLEGTTLGPDCEVGPFARLRPGTVAAEKAKIGNFVETKNASLASGSKINHLTYVGDASIGERTNVGAGVVTANYDGFGKYRTEIADDVFVGTNSTLVAPVSIGAGSNIAAGSVVTSDVQAGSLTFGRARQVDKPDRAASFRKAAAERKDAARKEAAKDS